MTKKRNIFQKAVFNISQQKKNSTKKQHKLKTYVSLQEVM